MYRKKSYNILFCLVLEKKKKNWTTNTIENSKESTRYLQNTEEVKFRVNLWGERERGRETVHGEGYLFCMRYNNKEHLEQLGYNSTIQ